MSSNSNTNGKKKGVLGTIVTLVVAAAVYFFSGNLDSTQGTPDTRDMQSIQTQSSYESQVQQDSPQSMPSTEILGEEMATQVFDEKEEPEETPAVTYFFRNEDLLESHYQKHGIEMGFDSAEEYEAAVSKVVSHPDVLYKREAEDNDHVYYLEETNEFVVISTDGYIRTYFLPSRGIDYFNKQ